MTKASWIGAFLFLGLIARSTEAGTFPDVGYLAPAGWTGPRFELSQDYPAMPPAPEVLPWKAIDFKTHPVDYMNAVIEYCYDGNLTVDFVSQNNAARKWYHAPWLHWGTNGREFVHGLTRERTSRRFELAATQNSQYRNVAVGFYNPAGGFIIGQVWKDPDAPNTAAVRFPEGTVSFKLLFTAAPVAKVPFLNGSPEWVADINRSPDPALIANTKVRLLQVDIAVRDDRAISAGWVFGTFHYDNAIADPNPWKRLRPLALLWGNDPTLTPTTFAAGARTTEGWVNPDSPIVMYRSNPPAGIMAPAAMGWAGRGNGPVDNPVSSCLSCHSAAQIPAKSSMIPQASLTESQKLRWFRNLMPGEPFDSGAATLDFSLQLGVGIQNLQDFQRLIVNRGGFVARAPGPGPFLRDDERRDPNAGPRAPQQYRISRDPDQ